MWCPENLLDQVALGLRDRADALDAEQAVRGLDALTELQLHPLIQAAFRDAGLGVFPEWPYPTPRAHPAPTGSLPQHRERERCDLVLTLDPARPPADPVHEQHETIRASQTLFADLMGKDADPTTPPEDAMWIEVKAVGQHAFIDGVPVPNRTYSSELVQGPAADAVKLARDPRIHHAACLLILFTADERTAEHDLGALMHRLLDRGLNVASPAVARFPITDRIGNAVCALAMIRVRKI